jgi:hypothetical protein
METRRSGKDNKMFYDYASGGDAKSYETGSDEMLFCIMN